MGGNTRGTKKASFSVLGWFKGGGGGGGSNRRGGNNRRAAWEDHQPQGSAEEHYARARKVWPSEEDNINRGRWVADPRIDTKASAFIAHFHATRVSDSELQVFQAAPANN